nr:hypothetical protein BaRGS_004992 [Batillaria attramentaria]
MVNSVERLDNPSTISNDNHEDYDNRDPSLDRHYIPHQPHIESHNPLEILDQEDHNAPVDTHVPDITAQNNLPTRCWDGDLQQIYGDCLPPMCVDPVQGSCCLYCPNGNNCRLPSGKVLSADDVAEDSGMLCRCPEQDWSGFGGGWGDDLSKAICEREPTTIPFTTTSPIPPTTTQFTTPSPTSLTTTPVTTTPAGCVTERGDYLLPGEDKSYRDYASCTIYECDLSGEVHIMIGDCMPPACVDPVQGSCCMYCPDGNNCRLPSGEIIPANEEVYVDGAMCKCPEQTYIFGGVDEALTDAICGTPPQTTFPPPPPPPPASTSPTPEPSPMRDAPAPGRTTEGPEPEASSEAAMSEGCLTDVGRWLALRPGEELVEGCEGCTCLENGTGVCYQIACRQPACVDAYVPAGGCCEQCPNGRNCLLPSGQIIPAGQTVGYDDTKRCRCPEYKPGDVWDAKELTAYCWNVGEGLSPEERIAERRKIVAAKREETRRKLAERRRARRTRIVERRRQRNQEDDPWDKQTCICTETGLSPYRVYPVTIQSIEYPGRNPEDRPEWTVPHTREKILCSKWDSNLTPHIGDNCALPSGEVIPAGKTVERDGKTYPSRYSCTMYKCDADGQLQQMIGDCLPPMCVNPEMGTCCMYCPQGDNCALPSGEVIPAGKTVERDGIRLRDSETETPTMVTSFGKIVMAVLLMTALTPTVGADEDTCRTPQGKTLKKGERVEENGMTCECVGKDPEALCLLPKTYYDNSNVEDDENDVQVSEDDDNENDVIVSEADDDENDNGKKSRIPEEGTEEWRKLKQARMERRKKIAEKYFQKKRAKMAAQKQKRTEKRRQKAQKLKEKRIRLRKEEREKMKKLRESAIAKPQY